MIDVYAYLDYRAFLRDLLPEHSHRELAQRGGFDAGLVSKVVNGSRNISPAMAERFAKAFALEGRPARFFCLLVLYNQARLPSERKKRLADLLAYGKNRISPITRLQHKYYTHWYHVAIRELINCGGWNGNDYKALAERLTPAISTREAKEAVEVLLELDMVRRDDKGQLHLVDPLISSGYEGQPLGVNEFISQGLQLAQEALDRFTPEERNLSALTLSISESSRSEIVRRLRQFRREILELVEHDPQPSRVYELNMQLFPLSKDNADA